MLLFNAGGSHEHTQLRYRTPFERTALQVDARGSEVTDRVGVGVVGHRRAIRGDVVRDELAKERESGGDARIVSFRILIVLPG